MTTTIEIYPPVRRRPSWMKVGAICEVMGEGRGNLFRVVEVEDRSLILEDLKGNPQGRESMTKCYRSFKARQAEGLAKAKPRKRKPMAAMYEKAQRCVRIARVLLGDGAPSVIIENKACALMHLSENDLAKLLAGRMTPPPPSTGRVADFKRWWASLSDEQLTALLDTKPPGVLGPWEDTPLGRACRFDHRGREGVQVWYDDRSRATPWRWHFEFESGQAKTRAAAHKEADKALRKKGWRLRNTKS